MFWSDVSTDRIYRALLDGTGATTLVSTGLTIAGTYDLVQLWC